MPTDEPSWLADAVSHIDLHYSSPLSLAAVAAFAGVHRATLASAFRRFRGCSVGEYLRELRVRRAGDALLATRAPLDDIALQHGFCDQSHFARVFKRMTGITPAQWRRGQTSQSSKAVSTRNAR